MILKFQRTDDLRHRFTDGEPKAVETVRALVARAVGPYKASLGESWEDVASKAFLTVYEACTAGEVSGCGPFEGWIWRVVAHDCLDELRRRRRWHMVGLDTVIDLEDGENSLSQLLELEREGSALELLGEASAECREIWALQLRGWTYGRMSEYLGASEGALRVRCLRCRRWARSHNGSDLT